MSQVTANAFSKEIRKKHSYVDRIIIAYGVKAVGIKKRGYKLYDLSDLLSAHEQEEAKRILAADSITVAQAVERTGLSDTYLRRMVEPVVRYDNKLYYTIEAVDAFAKEFRTKEAAKAAAREAANNPPELPLTKAEQNQKRRHCKKCQIRLDGISRDYQTKRVTIVPTGTATHCGWCVAEGKLAPQPIPC
jgi:hypothetical protein